MKLKFLRGTTSKLLRVFIQDTTSTTGSGLTGLTSGSAGLTWYYIREGDSAPTAVTPAAGTVGTWSSGGFAEISASNLPGVFEIGIPNAAISAGNSVVMMLKGVSNMAPVLIEIELDAVNYQDAARFGLSALPASGTLAVTPTLNATQAFNNTGQTTALPANLTQVNGSSAGGEGGTAQAGSTTTITLSASDAQAAGPLAGGWQVVTTGGTGAGQASVITAYNTSTRVATITGTWVAPDSTTTYRLVAPATASTSLGSTAPAGWINAAAIAAGALTATKFATDSIDAAAISAASVTKIQAGLATPTNITAGTLTTVTNVTNAPTAGDFTATMKTSLGTANTDSAGVTTLLGRVTGAVALASQIPANFTTATFTSAGVFSSGALANAPTSGSVSLGANAPAGWLNAAAFAANSIDGPAITSAAVTKLQANLATASQIPAGFTTATFASPGVFAGAALANAPTSGSVSLGANAPAGWLNAAAFATDALGANAVSAGAVTKVQAGLPAAVATAMASAPVGSVAGDVAGKVLGGGSGTITGIGANANAYAGGLVLHQGDGTATAAASGTITLDSTDPAAGANLAGWQVQILSATAGAGQVATIASSNTGTRVQTLAANWATTPTGTINYALIPPGVGTTATLGTDSISAAAMSSGAVAKITQGLAQFGQIPASFTSATFSAPGVFAASSLANVLDGPTVETGYSARAVLKLLAAALGTPSIGNLTTSVIVGGAALPAPTTGSYTTIHASMVGVDRTAVNSVTLSTT